MFTNCQLKEGYKRSAVVMPAGLRISTKNTRSAFINDTATIVIVRFVYIHKQCEANNAKDFLWHVWVFFFLLFLLCTEKELAEERYT